MFFTIINECLMLAIIMCTNIGEELGMGLIVNFGAVLIISEIDNIAMRLAGFEEIRDEENRKDETSDD